jgi:hypothetical protein
MKLEEIMRRRVAVLDVDQKTMLLFGSKGSTLMREKVCS